jgi:hypothetical protein
MDVSTGNRRSNVRQSVHCNQQFGEVTYFSALQSNQFMPLIVRRRRRPGESAVWPAVLSTDGEATREGPMEGFCSEEAMEYYRCQSDDERGEKSLGGAGRGDDSEPDEAMLS